MCVHAGVHDACACFHACMHSVCAYVRMYMPGACMYACICVVILTLLHVPQQCAQPPPSELDERGGQGEQLQEKINSLEKELKFMEVKKNEAINKLAQVCDHTHHVIVWVAVLLCLCR